MAKNKRMTEDKRLEEIRTNLVDAKKAMQIPWFWSNEDIEMLLSEIDRLKEENEAYLIGGSMFAETGLSQSKKIKELEDHRDILVNSFAELTEDEITKEDVLNVLKQHDSLDSDIARIATLEAKLKEIEYETGYSTDIKMHYQIIDVIVAKALEENSMEETK